MIQCLNTRFDISSGSGKCNVYRTGDSLDRVYGALFELTAAQKSILDGFEGPGYDSVPILAHSPNGEIEAETYIAKPKSIDFSLTPFDWYKAFVVEGAKEVGLPDEYVSVLESTREMKDPNPDRARSNRSLLPLRTPEQ